MSIQNVSAKDLKRASKIKERIEKLEAELSSILTKVGSTVAAAPAPSKKKKKKMSRAAKAKISAAQKKRWRTQKSAEKE